MPPTAAVDEPIDTKGLQTIGQALGMRQHVDALKPSKLNPRKHFNEVEMAELQANIAKHGVILPIVGRQRKDHIEILDGERRWRAATAAGVSTVPVVLREMSDSDAIEFMILNSIQRQDLTPLEEASGFKALIDSNKSKYSAGYIADRIGRSEKYVWDRMKLLDLIPILKKLLDHERILVGHAEILAKLKPDDQQRAAKWEQRGYGSGDSGLWQQEDARLDFEDGKRPKPTVDNLFAGLKPVTVKELETWVGEHVRFDVDHMAKSAPLEFGQIAKDVEHAQALPGKGKKVISITNDYRVDDAAKDPSERTYGQQSWERADGKEKSKTCKHSVLGVFVAGPGYGTTLQVCINRDKCLVHFGTVIRAREKNAALRSKGKGGQAAQREQKTREQEDQRRQQAEANEKAWKALQPKAIAAIEAFIVKVSIAKLLPVLSKTQGVKVKNAEEFVRALAMRHATETAWSPAYMAQSAKRYGFDLPKWIADNQPAPAKDAAPAKTAKKR